MVSPITKETIKLNGGLSGNKYRSMSPHAPRQNDTTAMPISNAE